MKKTKDKVKENYDDKNKVIELSSDEEKSDQMDTDQTLDIEGQFIKK